MHRFCTRFIFIALMMVPHILQSMLVESIGGNCCKRRKELIPLRNEDGAQKVQYVQLKKFTSGKLGDKPYTFGLSSRLQRAGKSTILILQGIQTRDRKIFEKLQSEKSLFEPFLQIPLWKKHHDLSKSNKLSHETDVKVDHNRLKSFDNLEIYKNALYLDMRNNFTNSNIYLSTDSFFLSSESHYHSLLDHVRNLHKKEKYTFAILTKIKIRGNRYSHDGFLPVVVNKVGDVLEYVGTENIFDNSEESHWKDIFHKVRQLVEKPKELEELIVKCVQSEAKKEIDEMGLGDIAKEAMDPELQQVILAFKPYSKLTINDVTKIETTILKQDLLECKSKFRSHLRQVFCIGSIFGFCLFGFILSLSRLKYVRM